MLTVSKILRSINVCMILAIITACSTNTIERKIDKKIYFGDINMEGLSESQVQDFLINYSEEINVEPKDAAFNEDKWQVVPEMYGKKLNVEKTMNALFGSKEGERVTPIVDNIKPDITSDIINESITEIGSFSTRLLDNQKPRVKNIKTAANWLDNVKVMPGEEFSFNDALGKRTWEKGYRLAPIIVKTEEGPKKGYGVGGGICQLSTTLYNAAVNANLKITERHEHSRDVGYVEDGKDATVSFNSTDFKFINSRNNPVIIKVFVRDGKVTVKLYENKSIIKG